jgi:hypothetical protein
MPSEIRFPAESRFRSDAFSNSRACLQTRRFFLLSSLSGYRLANKRYSAAPFKSPVIVYAEMA